MLRYKFNKLLVGASMCLLFMSGCAFTDATLDVSADKNKIATGPISELTPIKVTVEKFEDARSDKKRIGYKKNGFGSNTADIFTAKPVNVVVENAIKDMLSKNGHVPSVDGSKIAINGKVKKFWFDLKPGFWTIEFIGDVEVELSVIDVASKQTIMSKTFKGYYNEESMGGLEATWQNVMDTALQEMLSNIVIDKEFGEALKRYAGSGAV